MKDRALERLRDHLRGAADALDAMLREDDWIDQTRSPLGKRAHLRAVREGKLSGHKVGARVLVRRSDLDAFIAGHRARPPIVTDAVGEEAAITEILNFRASRRRTA